MFWKTSLLSALVFVLSRLVFLAVCFEIRRKYLLYPFRPTPPLLPPAVPQSALVCCRVLC